MHKSNIQILKSLYDNNLTTPFQSITISKINQLLPTYSYSKLSRDLNELTTANYTLRGIKKSRAETFYITTQGIEYLKSIFTFQLST